MAQRYGRLFIDVQLSGVFGDGKVFVDAQPLQSPECIRTLYEAQDLAPGPDLVRFVQDHFALPHAAGGEDPAVPNHDALHHIETLWPLLTREPAPAGGPHGADTLLPLPHPYVVPGGRFSEIYYWDSYFTMLGLLDSGRHALVEGMVRNFAHLIDRHGHVPNGNRSYYLSRSQPPFFFKMVESLNPARPDYQRFLPQLKAEHAFWMAGEHAIGPNQACARVVRLAGGELLNRFWDDRDDPRDESYREDLHTAAESGRPPREVYRDLRAAAESGWDFSSRWLADPGRLASIETTAIVPVDLNSLMVGLEEALALGCEQAGDAAGASAYAERARQRRAAISAYCWDEDHGCYVDYHWRQARRRDNITAAMVVPLFMGVATREQAGGVATMLASRLLARNGLVTTNVRSGQQWDLPNGWAPLQWMAVEGLRRYGFDALARDIALRWIGCVLRVHAETGRLLEKYDVVEDKPGGGGEYPNQFGFGWTNGVLLKLLGLYAPATMVAA
jgi:alpha,alpha-trehalase